MLVINKLRADHVIDFAAEELKKYLRMMMPHCGEIGICYAPAASEGFRLGLLSDFSLECEGEDPVLDDVIHVDTDCEGGILAGSNPRSVLFAVYRLLRQNGCRWLYPGVDGEYVPMHDLKPTRYHKLADYRFRGHCNEGAESQQCMLETIDFYAKQELNVYMLEFDVPFYYYNSYYSHAYNTENRPPEPVTAQQVLQWKRQCEAEIAKRGLQFHDMGHGWTAEPFGLSSTGGWERTDTPLTQQQRRNIAQIGGVRELWGGVALNTNLCMSDPGVRSTMAKSIADYAETHRNVDFLHVWLADGMRNHCECDNCQKARPSDFYLMIMNELDGILTERALDTRIVFIAYVDTLFAPQTVRIENPKRFSLLYAPIFHSYTAGITENSTIPEAPPYARNRWSDPKSAEENLAFLRQWKKVWTGPVFAYEYHFWRYQYYDPAAVFFSRRVWEDVRSGEFMGLDGFVEDGSQRSFFPNGFNLYIYAQTLMDRNCDYEAEREDYYRHSYGDAWQQVLTYLQKASEAFDYAYVSGERSEDPARGSFYAPSRVEKLLQIKDLAARGREIARAHLAMPTRPQTVSMRLLLRHADYMEGLGEFLALMAAGENVQAWNRLQELRISFGKYEFELERYFDHGLAFKVWDLLAREETH